MFLLILYACVALGVSFLCSLLEAAFLSITPSYIGVLRKEGALHGEILLRLKADVDKSLASVLSLNTIAHTIGAVGVGAQAQLLFGEEIITLVSVLLTLAVLYLSEIIPKSIGATYWRGLSGFTARILPVLIILMYPLVWLATLLMNLLSSGETEPTLSREEVSAMADIGEEAGFFAEDESRILRNLMRFGDLKVRDIMTPRTVVFAAEETMTVSELWASRPDMVFSRIPIYSGSRDNVTGYVLNTDVLIELARDNDTTSLNALKRPITVVTEHQNVRLALDHLLRHNEHIALVVDEYGGMDGVVSMEDVVETLLGLEIMDESDINQDMQVLARQQWAQRAQKMGIDTEEAFFKLKEKKAD